MKYILFVILFASLLSPSCSSGEGGNLATVTDPSQRQSLNQCPPSSGLNLLATVAYWPEVREFLDANCISCHGVGNKAGLDFREYDVAKSTLSAKGESFSKIVSQVKNNHKNTYDASYKTLMTTWQSDSFLEFLPGKSISDYQNNGDNSSTGTDSGSTGTDGLNDTINNIVDQYQQNNPDSNFDSNNQPFANQSQNSGNAQPCN